MSIVGPDRALPTGKLEPRLLGELLAGFAQPPEVVLGPALGEDACAIAVGGGALVAATDPITLTGEEVGAFAVFVNANDVAVMGVRPRWFLATVLLPAGTSEGELRALFGSLRTALDRVGAALVGGHTEVTAAVTRPVVVGQMLGFSEHGRTVATGSLRPGDLVLQVGPAPVEGAAVLAGVTPPRPVDPALLRAAARAMEDPGILVVEPALIAAGAGARALHDPTEGGLSAGLWEMAVASGVSLNVDPDAVRWFEPGRELCRAHGLDPWGTLASGCLLAGAGEARAPDLVDALARAGYQASIIAHARSGAGVHTPAGPLPRYDRDEISRLDPG